ncbi:hypothetical protein amrb99_62140 [Actinomadura sp. RB99]|uniref:hypothetical protein n=1 Tax=Actinomadura sp. RB99 TaxID=2691577 RepID=UPI0016846F60|nr:hypothetical protein [Actinomadura sp. RB99]MBD2897255.1 hypothetical protein [Actinomadura sp. RB99]
MTTTPPVSDGPNAEDVEAPERRKGRYCGWTGKERFDYGAIQLRVALTKLARDPDPAARAAGVRFSAEAAELLVELATRADGQTTASKRARATADRMLARLAPKLDEFRAAQEARRP